MRRPVALLVLWFALLAPVTAIAQQAPPAPAPGSQAAQPKSSAPPPSSSAQGNPDVQVWVNMNSGVYHCRGDHWYGATKAGSYMKQGEAQQKGYRPANQRVCK